MKKNNLEELTSLGYKTEFQTDNSKTHLKQPGSGVILKAHCHG